MSIKNLKVVLFGEIKNKEYRSLFDYYQKIARKYNRVEVVYRKDPGKGKISSRDLDFLKGEGYSIALDNEGKGLTSEMFDSMLYDRLADMPSVCFVVGNAFGFEEEAKKVFDYKLSLSDMTFPHELAAVVLMEQLFRVGNIHANGSYHK